MLPIDLGLEGDPLRLPVQICNLHRFCDEVCRIGHILSDLAQHPFQPLVFHVQRLIRQFAGVDLAEDHGDQPAQFLGHFVAEIIDFLLQPVQLRFLPIHLLPVVANLAELELGWLEHWTPTLLEGIENLLNQGIPLAA